MSVISNLRIAIVHYWFLRRAGGERVVEVMADMFPQADLFALVARPDCLSPHLRDRRLHTSFLQRWPGSHRYHRLFLPFAPLALESFDLTDYDLVISSESGPAKGVITGSHTCHICYCHTPMRFLWELPTHYRQTVPGGALGRAAFTGVAHYMRMWDLATAARVDHFAATCENVAARIRKHYRREATVILPPIRIHEFDADVESGTRDFYLVISRLVSYKRIDLAIEACNRLQRRLVIVGGGEQRRSLEHIAGPTIEFVGEVTDAQRAAYYHNCRALLFPGEEDFGATPVEANASGRPVIAYGRGGALETIRPWMRGGSEPATGMLFSEQTVESLLAAMKEFEAQEHAFDAAAIRRHAQRFGVERFREDFGAFVDSCLAPQRHAAGA